MLITLADQHLWLESFFVAISMDYAYDIIYGIANTAQDLKMLLSIIETSMAHVYFDVFDMS